MKDEQYINSITLQYLLNPILQNKINSQKKNPDNLLCKDILFYRRRICDLTKQMCKGEYINSTFKTTFLNYVSFIIYYLKQQDEKDILQKEYDNLDLKVIKTNEDNREIQEISDISNNLGNDLLINKMPGDYSLDKFVNKKNIKEIARILPQERCANINDPSLKRKGLKKKNI